MKTTFKLLVMLTVLLFWNTTVNAQAKTEEKGSEKNTKTIKGKENSEGLPAIQKVRSAASTASEGKEKEEKPKPKRQENRRVEISLKKNAPQPPEVTKDSNSRKSSKKQGKAQHKPIAVQKPVEKTILKGKKIKQN